MGVVEEGEGVREGELGSGGGEGGFRSGKGLEGVVGGAFVARKLSICSIYCREPIFDLSFLLLAGLCFRKRQPCVESKWQYFRIRSSRFVVPHSFAARGSLDDTAAKAVYLKFRSGLCRVSLVIASTVLAFTGPQQFRGLFRC